MPAPLLASPPDTDQVTGAVPPPESVAENCSTDAPLLLVALQPVQLVSIEPVPGESEKLALEGSALTRPLAQPATTSSVGGSRKEAMRRASLLKTRECADFFAAVCGGCEGVAATCAPYGTIPILSLRRGCGCQRPRSSLDVLWIDSRLKDNRMGKT